MLFDYTDFGQVLQTLSKLSYSTKALQSGISGFPSYSRPPTNHDYYNEDIYENLEDHANDEYDDDNDLYDEIGPGRRHKEEEENIYEELCSFRKEDVIPAPSQAPVEKRVYCIRELVETEQNYVAVLNGILRNFIWPLKNKITKEDQKIVFMGIQNLCEIHTGFHSDLLKAFNGKETMKLSDCFLQWKDRFVIYGEYCSNLPKAQELIDDLCNKNEIINQAVLVCQTNYNDGKFKLRDLLSIPMQRVLKYHLFLVELRKNTSDNHEDYTGLQRALDGMIDLSQYINEVKRDSETLQIIGDIQKHINDLVMPGNLELKDYGRLLRDGEIKIRSQCDGNKLMSRYVFIFDLVLLVCKATRGEQYSFKEALSLPEYNFDDNSTNKTNTKDKWSHTLVLVHCENKTTFTMHAETEEMKNKWAEALKTALDNITPSDCSNTDHLFDITSFDQPSNCDFCQKLLRGIYYQGYMCRTCRMQVHKGCIGFVRSCGAARLPPKPTHFENNSTNNAVARTSRTYHSTVPTPPEQGEAVSANRKQSPKFWFGRQRTSGQEEPFLVDRVKDLLVSSRVTFTKDKVNSQIISPISSPVLETQPQILSEFSRNDILNLDQYDWFAGNMDHDSASHCILKLPNGSFLVRISKRQNGQYIITLKHEHKAKHIKVFISDDGCYFLTKSKVFKTIVELVKWHEQNCLSACFLGLDTTLRKPYKMLMNGPNVIGYAIANYDFLATDSGMLSLKKGDRVAILSKRGGDKGWWKGLLEPKIGYFPLEYVTEDPAV